jgi:hypothetical protein
MDIYQKQGKNLARLLTLYSLFPDTCLIFPAAPSLPRDFESIIHSPPLFGNGKHLETFLKKGRNRPTI